MYKAPIADFPEAEAVQKLCFIDTVRALLPLRHTEPICSGESLWLKDGTGELHSKGYTRDKVEGPFGNTVAVCSAGVSPHDYLEITCSPLKIVQGHNLFGTSDLVPLLAEVGFVVADGLGLSPTDEEKEKWLAGQIELKQVDCTLMVHLGSQDEVDSAIEVLKLADHERLRQKAVFPHSVYFKEAGGRYSFKAYAKWHEIQNSKTRIPESVPGRDQLTESAEDALRFEVTLRNPKLKTLKAKYANQWSTQLVAKVLADQVSSIITLGDPDIARAGLDELPPKLKMPYIAWEGGASLKEFASSRTTREKYRRQILEATGIDVKARFETCAAAKEKYPQISISGILSKSMNLLKQYQ